MDWYAVSEAAAERDRNDPRVHGDDWRRVSSMGVTSAYGPFMALRTYVRFKPSELDICHSW
jgi:hypothetical protein